MIRVDLEGFPLPRNSAELYDIDSVSDAEVKKALGATGLTAFDDIDEYIGVAGPNDMDGWVIEYDPAPEGGRPTATKTL